MSFEEESKELDKILEKLESGEVGLAEGVELFKKGEELLERSYKQLNDSKGQILVLKEKLGQMTEEEM